MSESKDVFSHKFFLVFIIIALVLAIAFSLYTCFYNYKNNLAKNSINPLVIENFTYPGQEPILNLSNCKLVYDYGYDDPSLPVLELSCNDSSLNVLRISEPSRHGIVLLVIQIIEYKPKISSNLIRHYSIEDGYVYVILSNHTKIRVLPIMDKAIKTDSGGLIVLGGGTSAVHIMFKARYNNGRERDFAITCTMCEILYISLK